MASPTCVHARNFNAAALPVLHTDPACSFQLRSALHGQGSSCSLFPPTADTSMVKASSLWLGKGERGPSYVFTLPPSISSHTRAHPAPRGEAACAGSMAKGTGRIYSSRGLRQDKTNTMHDSVSHAAAGNPLELTSPCDADNPSFHSSPACPA